MTTITIEGYEYSIPAGWLDITIGQLQDLTALQANSEPSLDRDVIETSILTGIPEDLLNEVSFQDYSKIRGALSFIDRSYPEKMTPVFTALGVDYEFNADIENMTTAEFIDFDTLQKRGIPELHVMLAILYRPKSESKFRYDTVEVRKRANLFREYMPAEVALSAMAFTVVLGQALLAASPAYSEYLATLEKTEETDMTQTLKTLIPSSGDGESASSK